MFMPKVAHGNMPNFAKISDSNVVEKVEVFSQEDVNANGGDYSSGVEAWVSSYKGGGTWKQTSYNSNARGTFAGVGWLWEPTKEKFYMPKKSGYKLNKGDIIIFMTGGGGGYGNPSNRKTSSIKNDLKQGYLSEKYVKQNYINYSFT